MNKNRPRKSPFPWTCSRCRQKALYEAIVDYSIDIGHDGRIYHVKIDKLKAPKCKHCGQVAPDSEADEQITRAFLKQAKLLLPEQIQGNREALSLTREQLAAALGIEEGAVARWEDGFQIQKRSLDNLLRLFFGVPKARDLLIKGKLSKLGLVLRDKSLATA